MSSLTTAISSGVMEESQELDTRLSLVIGAGSQPPPPVPVLLPVPSPENEAAGRSKRKGPDNVRDSTTATSRQHSKRAKRVHGGSAVDDDVGDEFRGGARKKLRLSEEQVALLNKSFRAHRVLSHGEKHDLARELGLKPRQVEVWFQNRRARIKLKQTELDCELLRRWCERLSDDNVRLQSSLAEARTLLIVSRAQGSGLKTLSDNTGCPSSNRIAGGRTVA